MRRMNLWLGLAVALVSMSAVAQNAGAQKQNAVKVTKSTTPEKRLDFEVVVAGGLEDVWKCFSTRAGMIEWLTPDAEVELKPGGAWLAKFGPSVAPGGGKILSFEPRQFIAIHAMAPEMFPTVRREGTTAVFTFDPVDEAHTVVHLSQTGWKDSEEWNKAYAYLAEGNAQLLSGLKGRFDHGPVDWANAMVGKKEK